jgi:hypothetical protein
VVLSSLGIKAEIRIDPDHVRLGFWLAESSNNEHETRISLV